MCLALHELICKPSCKQSSQYTSNELGHSDDVSRKCDVITLELGKEGSSPLEDCKSDYIYTEIGHCKDPDDRVSEDHLSEEGLELIAFELLSMRRCRFYCCSFLPLQLLYFRKTD
jgi:hypothetical protein